MSIFAQVEELFSATRGKANTQLAFIYADEFSAKEATKRYGYTDRPEYDCHVGTAFVMRKQACFATASVVSLHKDSLKYVIYDVANVRTAYSIKEEMVPVAYEMASLLYHLPYVKKYAVNKSFKDAMENGLRIRVDQNMSNEELFLPMYLLRHVWERQAYHGYAWLRKNTKLTKREAALFALTFRNNIRGQHVWQEGGHSVLATDYRFSPKYFFNLMNGGVPDFEKSRTNLLNSSPAINRLMGGQGKENAKLPYITVGEGWGKQYVAEVSAVVDMYLKFKEKAKNAKPA